MRVFMTSTATRMMQIMSIDTMVMKTRTAIHFMMLTIQMTVTKMIPTWKRSLTKMNQTTKVIIPIMSKL